MEIGLDNMNTNNSGGVGAKKGFLFQDYVAAYFVTKMLRDKRIKGICCEVKDDIDIIYDDRVCYVQIKTTDSNSRWNISELKERTKEQGKTRYNNDSIIHKSISCDDSDAYLGMFKIVTNRDVDSKLEYFKIDKDKRGKNKKERDILIRSLAKSVKTDFVSKNGNNIEYWVDNCDWEVYQDIAHIESYSLQNIRNAAADDGYMLDPSHDESQILNSILVEVVKLSAKSKKINLSEDKTYFRRLLIKWFKSEVERLSQTRPKKVYSRQKKDLPQVLVHLNDCSDSNFPSTSGSGFYQSYGRKSYRFEFISKTLVKWLPEILLRPEELSGIQSTTMLSSADIVYDSIRNNNLDIQDLIGKTLLHSMLRHNVLSQPIPASLYVEKKGDFLEFNNIHIVKKDNDLDELWLGMSYICNGQTKLAIDDSAKKIEAFIDANSDEHRQIILDIKSDDYLVKHDIDTLLNPALSINDSLPRIQFIIFIGYLSVIQGKELKKDYEHELKLEITNQFSNFLVELENNHNDILDLKFKFYIYPIPCIHTLIENFKAEIAG